MTPALCICLLPCKSRCPTCRTPFHAACQANTWFAHSKIHEISNHSTEYCVDQAPLNQEELKYITGIHYYEKLRKCGFDDMQLKDAMGTFQARLDIMDRDSRNLELAFARKRIAQLLPSDVNMNLCIKHPFIAVFYHLAELQLILHGFCQDPKVSYPFVKLFYNFLTLLYSPKREIAIELPNLIRMASAMTSWASDHLSKARDTGKNFSQHTQFYLIFAFQTQESLRIVALTQTGRDITEDFEIDHPSQESLEEMRIAESRMIFLDETFELKKPRP